MRYIFEPGSYRHRRLVYIAFQSLDCRNVLSYRIVFRIVMFFEYPIRYHHNAIPVKKRIFRKLNSYNVAMALHLHYYRVSFYFFQNSLDTDCGRSYRWVFDGGWNESSCLLPIQYQCRCGGKLFPSLGYTVYLLLG